MFDFLVYLVQSAVCLAALYLIYKVAMSHETLHRLNRILLLGSVILSAMLPLCRVKIVKEYDPAPTISAVEIEDMVVADVAQLGVDYISLLKDVAVMIFVVGVAFMLVRLAYGIYSVWRLIHSGQMSVIEEDVTLTVVDSLSSPFSWFGHIVASKEDVEQSRQMILEHELAHIRLRHSWDVMAVDVAMCLWWFNPALWLLRRELQSLHEYQADDAVLRCGIDAKTYQMLLIKRAVGSRLHSVANCLNHSNLKNRITMMCKKTSSRWAATKALLVVPMVAVALSAFATTEYVPREVQDKITENFANLQDEENTKPLVVIDGKIVAYEEMNNLNPNTIDNMSVFKEDKAREYAAELNLNISAEDVKDGLVVITLKKDGQSTSSAEATKGKIVIADNKSANIRASVRQALQMNLQPVAGLYGAISAKITVKPDGTVGKFSAGRASGEYTKQDLGPLVGKVLSAIVGINGKFTPPAEATTYNYDISFCIKDGDKTLASEAYLAEDAIVVLSYADSANSVSTAKTTSDNQPLIKAEKMPKFQGGDLNRFVVWMQGQIKYPAEAVEKGLSGRVIFSFVVEKDGSTSDFTVLATPDKVLSDEVKRVFDSAPKAWTAGEENGKKVRVKFTVPIVFTEVADSGTSTNFESVFAAGMADIAKADALDKEISGKKYDNQADYKADMQKVNNYYKSAMSALESAYALNPQHKPTVQSLYMIAFRLRDESGMMAKYEKYKTALQSL